MPPCDSPLKRTTKSVPLPVSELNASSEMIREDRGDAIPAIRSNGSCGSCRGSKKFFYEVQFNGVGGLRGYISFTHWALQ
jgi:hypothetical protein